MVLAPSHVTKWINSMKEAGFITEANIEDIAVFTKHRAVDKKGTAEKRFVGNFIPLNEMTAKISGLKVDGFKLAHKLAGFPWKAKIDLSAGFYTVRAAHSAKKYLGIYHKGHAYVYQRMPMGPRNSPAVFSYFLPSLFEQTLVPGWQEYVTIYQDDILIGGRSPDK